MSLSEYQMSTHWNQIKFLNIDFYFFSPASLTNLFLLNVETLQLVHVGEDVTNMQDSEPLRCLALQGIRLQINFDCENFFEEVCYLS